MHRRYNVSLLIKRANKKKSNSHMWWFGAHAKEVGGGGGCRYAFATDCATLFDRDCLRLLVEKLDTDMSCTACCARQRVMSVKWQVHKDRCSSAPDVTQGSVLLLFT